MFSNFALLDFSTPDLVIILAILLVLFGGKKLPELSKSIGESIRELKNASGSAGELHREVKGQINDVKTSFNGDTKSEL